MLLENRWRLLQIVNMGTLISTIDVGIVNLSLPVMAEQYGVSFAQIQWIATVYLLTLVLLLSFMGKLSDRTERRTVYSLGFLLFGAGSLCTAVAGSFAAILLARCLQGVGATMIMANSQAMVRELFPDHERGRALGINAIFISAGTLSGPALGGLLLEVVDWPWLFWINVPISLAACAFGFLRFPRAKGSGAKSPMDLAGTALLGAGACLLMLAAEAVQTEGYVSPAVWAEGALGILSLGLLGIRSRLVASSILDRELFRHRKVSLGNAGSFLINLAQNATLIPIAFYLHGGLGYSSWATGAILMIQPLVMGAVAPFAGRFRDKVGGGPPIRAGALLCSASMLFVALPAGGSLPGIVLQLAVFGAGIGLFHATNNAEIMSAAPAAKSSLAGSLLALVRYLGQIAGIGLATLFVGSAGAGGGEEAPFGLPFRMLFLLCFLLCLPVAFAERLLPKARSEAGRSERIDG